MASDGVKWIMVSTDIFDSDGKLFAIEQLPDGYLIELVWFKILVLTGKLNNSGLLINSAKIPYTDEMLAGAFRIDIGTIKRAIDIFEKMEMIDVLDNSYMVSGWLEHQSEAGLALIRENERVKKAKYREKQRENALLEVNEKCPQNVSDKSTDSSYSNSNNIIINKLNNIDLYISLKDNHKSNYDEFFNYISNDKLLEDSLIEWLDYKNSRKKSEKYQESSLQTLVKKFVVNAKKFGSNSVLSVVEDSISNQYQGIVWDNISNDKFSNENSIELYKEFDSDFDEVFKRYPNKNNYTRAKELWAKKVKSADNQRDMAKAMYMALRKYFADYSKKKGNDYTYVKSLDKFLTDDLDYWLQESRNV